MSKLCSWHWTSVDGRFGLEMRLREVRQVVRMCKKSDPIETGGVLVGRYNRALTTAVICRVLPPPPDSKRGPTSFERGVTGLAALLRTLWQQNREHYVGEWHYHPRSSPEPSNQDVLQARRIAIDPAYCCPVPVLLIVGGFHKNWTFSVQVVSADTLIRLGR